MIVPNLEGIVKAIPEPEMEARTTASFVAGNTGIHGFGRRSRHAAVQNDRGPKRHSPAAVTAEQRAVTPTETLKAEYPTSGFTSTTTAPPILSLQVELGKRQTSRSSTLSCANDLVYVSCADGSFNGCGNSAICDDVVTISTISTISVDGPSPTQSSTPTTSSPAATTTASSSASPPIGAVVGGVIGGLAVLALIVSLLIFCIKQKRKNVERRRLEAANPFFPKKTSTPPPPPPLYPDRHQRNGSTCHDIYGAVEGGAGGSSRTNIIQRSEKTRLIDTNSLQANPSPGLRAEGGPGLPPAAFLRPAQMLDGRPINEIGGYERRRSSASGSRVQEGDGAVEMEDTSGLRAAIGIQRDRSPPAISQDSPILGRNPGFNNSAPLPRAANDDVTKRQHLMSWTSYASDGDGEEMSATLNSAKSPPSARSSPSRASEQSSGLRLSDTSYVVSPLRKEKF